jgi:hypothetical protein
MANAALSSSNFVRAIVSSIAVLVKERLYGHAARANVVSGVDAGDERS